MTGLVAILPTPADGRVATGFKQGLELLTVGTHQPSPGVLPDCLVFTFGAGPAAAELQALQLECRHAPEHRIVARLIESIPRLELA